MRPFLLFVLALIALGAVPPAGASDGDPLEASLAEAASADPAFASSFEEAAFFDSAFDLGLGAAPLAETSLGSRLSEAAAVDASSASLVGPDGSAMAVGGGRQLGNTFAFFARREADGTTTGRMFYRIGGSGETLFAPVECLAAAGGPDGGGIATIQGELDPPFNEVFRSLIFLVTDTTVPLGQADPLTLTGDQLTFQVNPSPPGEGLPCEPAPGGTPINSGNIVVRAG